MCVCNNPGKDNYETLNITLRVRGSTSAKEYAKKSFRLTTHMGANGTKQKQVGIKFMGEPATMCTAVRTAVITNLSPACFGEGAAWLEYGRCSS